MYKFKERILTMFAMGAFLLVSVVAMSANAYDGTISDYRIGKLTTEEGLSQSSVQSICQDKLGYVWLGTKDGLDRYDGYGFVSFKSNPFDAGTLSTNDVVCVTSDADNNLYIGTRCGGLNKYLMHEDRIVRMNDVVPSTATVEFVFFDQDSNMLIGTEFGLFSGVPCDTCTHGYNFSNVSQKSVYRAVDGSILARTKNFINTVSVCQLSQNVYLVGTGSGLFIYRRDESTFQLLDLGYLSLARVNSIARRGETDFFIATSNGMGCYQWNENSLIQKQLYSTFQPAGYRLESNWISVLVLDSANTVWGGGRGMGLFRIGDDLKVASFTSDPVDANTLNDKTVNSLMIDACGVLWIGTESKGCGMLDLNRKPIFRFDNIDSYKANFNNDVVTAIAGDGKGTLYIGSAHNGLHRVKQNATDSYSVEPMPIGSYANMQSKEILSLYFDSKKNLWISSLYNWITKVDAKGRYSTFPTSAFVFTIFEDSFGNIWIGTWGGGFSKVDASTGQILTFNTQTQTDYQTIGGDRVLSFGEDTYGNLWVGTKGGGVSVSPINLLTYGMSNFVTYKFSEDSHNSLSNNDVNCIFRDSRGTMWIGTGNGLNRFVLPEGENKAEAIMQNKGHFVCYTSADGLPNSNILSIVEDDSGFLWIGTVNGLARIDTRNYAIATLGKNDGLQSNEYFSRSCFKDDNGNIYFGGVDGVSFFNPGKFNTSGCKFQTRITGLKISNNIVRPGQEIDGRIILKDNISTTGSLTLWPSHKDFTIEFSGMNYANAGNVRYAYRLKGYNDEWLTTGCLEHSATYTSLRQGRYVFQVRPISGGGAWSDSVAELKITVKPVLWRSPWFFAVYFMFVLVVLFFFRKYSIIDVKVRNKLEIEAYEKQKAVELTEAKMRFFTNISHEIRTPLSLIYGPLDNVLQTQQLADDVRNDLNLVRKNVSRLIGLTDKLLQIKKIDMGTIEPQFECIHFIPYLKDILEYFNQQFRNKDIDISVQLDIDSTNDEVWIDKEMLTTAIYNIISNAFKYTPEKGSITIGAFISDSRFNDQSARKITTSTQYLNIEIGDTGIGIPENDLNNIFERFFQASNQAETGQAGSGIGLSIVKDYVEMHNGAVHVESKQGQGTVFTIQIPLGTAHTQGRVLNAGLAEAVEGGQLAEPMPQGASSETGNQNANDEQRPLLLIAEDDVEMLSFLERSFAKNYRVVTATDGKKAWTLVQSSLPDMLISDIMMPELDGRELCSLVKSTIETSHIPVILLSARATEEAIIEGYEQGADRYVSKPFALNVLEAQVSQLLSTRRQLIDLYSQKILLKPRDITITSMDEKFLSKIIDIIEDNISDTGFDVSTIVDKMNMSHSSVLKKIKALTGVSLVEFVRRHRLNKAAMIFEQEKMPITEVAYMVGFSDPKYFSKCFSKQFGKTPSEFVAEALQRKTD